MFSTSTLDFLEELAANNERDWFETHRQRYEDEVRTPALNYIEAMEEPLAKISPYFTASARKVGGSLMRIHRDVRFAKDKSPYKTNVGIQFRHVRGKDVHAPGFYLHIEPDNVFIGAGIWKPDNTTLKAVRALIDDYPDEWRQLKKKVLAKGEFELRGDSLKRPPAGHAADHPLIDDLKRKDFMAIAELPVASVSDKSFKRQTIRLFTKASPLVRFICEADDLAF